MIHNVSLKGAVFVVACLGIASGMGAYVAYCVDNTKYLPHVVTAMLGSGLVAAAIARAGKSVLEVDEITAKRINLVDDNGRPQMVIMKNEKGYMCIKFLKQDGGLDQYDLQITNCDGSDRTSVVMIANKPNYRSIVLGVNRETGVVLNEFK